jgi:hypothetical protein
LEARVQRAATLAEDAQVIRQLRGRPHQATEVGLPSSDLLERVARAMQAAGLDARALVSTLPQPPRRLPNSEHAEVVHRLVFEAVPLEGLVRFGEALTRQNPELRLSGFQLRAGQPPTTWNADVSVSYWVLSAVR